MSKPKPEKTAKALVGFAGIGGVEISLREAEIETTGIEIDPAIAEVNRANGGNVIAADILDIDPSDYDDWWLYHFSPPCPNFSVANQTSSETEVDINLARKICDFVRLGRPEHFTLENVWLYRKSLSWLLVWYTLLDEGYGVGVWHLNAADYGVPQTRKRMIVIARRDGQQPAKPWPTHAKNPDMFTQPWRGWYEAIDDLIPDLPETRFADWQMDRMPAFTVTGGSSRLRAFLLAQGQRSQPKPSGMPADTITANNNQTGVKALVINNQNSSRALTVRNPDEPVMTITCSRIGKGQPEAFVVDCQNNGSPDKLHGLTIRAGLTSGRIVSMTPRCLARFQDFPDDFILPGENGLIGNQVLAADARSDRELACRGIGNALPSRLYRAILESLGLKLLRKEFRNEP